MLKKSELVVVFLERLLVPALERRDLAAPRVASDDEGPLAPREEGLLQLDRAAGGALGPREVAEKRRAVSQLQRGPAVARIQLEGPLELGRRLGEAREPDEVGPPERMIGPGVRRVELQGPGGSRRFLPRGARRR